MTSSTTALRAQLPETRAFRIGLLLVTVAVLLYTFRRPLYPALDGWFESPEYSHGPLIPLIAAMMIWRDSQRATSPMQPSWAGIWIACFGFFLRLFAVASSLNSLGQIGFVIAIIGFVVAINGVRRSVELWPGLAFAFFALPLADSMQFDLTWKLQLISSDGGVGLLRLLSIPVLQEGNVIDLGETKLQVAEACSGLRYLLPLGSFSFVCAYLFRAHWTARLLVFLSAIPITIAMNCVRIAVTGILVNAYGIGAAEGFFHYFEGWVVFCLCLAVLLAEMKLIALVDGRGRALLPRLDLTPPRLQFGDWIKDLPRVHILVLLALTCATAVTGYLLSERLQAMRAEGMPRQSFVAFPQHVGEWRGFEAPIEQDTLDQLASDDHLSLNFVNSANEPVNLWVAYYKAGKGIHSPLVCIPGGGWEIESLDTTNVEQPAGSVQPVAEVNRLVIRRGTDRQVVYYWFQGRGKIDSTGYASNLRMLHDAFVRGETGEALVRFATPLQGSDGIAEADRRIRAMIAEVAPLLPRYIP